MNYYKLFVWLHLSAGTVALLAFWLTAALRKGSRAHILVGRLFLIAMSGVVVTAVPLAGFAFSRGMTVLAVFLLYLLVITATPCWAAWRAIRDQKNFAHYSGPLYRAIAWINIVAGAIVLALGLSFNQVIFIGISSVGLITGPLMLRFARKPPQDRRWWLVEHFTGVIGAGVATHIAFLSIGAARLLPPHMVEYSQMFAWFGPLTIAFVARFWIGYRYRTGSTFVGVRA
jgi:hypothetical protein